MHFGQESLESVHRIEACFSAQLWRHPLCVQACFLADHSSIGLHHACNIAAQFYSSRKKILVLPVFLLPSGTACPLQRSCPVHQHSPSLSESLNRLSVRNHWQQKEFQRRLSAFDHFCREGFPFGDQNATRVNRDLAMSCVWLISGFSIFAAE